MKNVNKKILLITVVSLAIIFFSLPAKAQDVAKGCCKVVSPGQHITIYDNKTEEQCKAYNYAPPYGEPTIATFEANKIASDDRKSCVVEKVNKIYEGPSKIIPPTLSVSIPGFGKFTEVKCDNPDEKCQIPWLAEYIKALYKYSISIIGILATIVVMIGGVLWLTAAGNKERIGSAKNYIKGGILGITIALCSYVLLFILNPNLVILSPINIDYLDKNDLDHVELVKNGSETDEAPVGCPDPSKIVNITTENTGAGSITAEEKKWLQGSIDEFKKVVKIAKDDYGLQIRIASAFRSMDHQTRLFNDAVKKYGSESAARQWVAKPSCGAPHVRGVAVDAYAIPMSSTNQKKLQQAFQKAGWQRYCKESWHFQIPSAPPKVPCSP